MKHYRSKGIFPLWLLVVLLYAPLVDAQNVPARLTLLVMEGEGVTMGVRQRVPAIP